MENWTDYTDNLTADDADALAAIAEAGIPDEEEGTDAPLPEYGCAENEGLAEAVCDNAAYGDGDACPEHGGQTAAERRAYVAEARKEYEGGNR
jgi:hypothetical protein